MVKSEIYQDAQKFKTLLQKVENLRLEKDCKNETLRLVTNAVLRLNEMFPRPTIF